jgi:exopolysaccharide production protein ExoY
MRRRWMMDDLRGDRPHNGLGALGSLSLPRPELVFAASVSGQGGATSLAAEEAQYGSGHTTGPGKDEPLGGWPKRLTDITIATAGLLLAGPVMLLVALLILMTDRGPIFFAHSRIGFRGQPFRCFKFRTMATAGDTILDEYLAAHPEAAAEWQESRKLAHDPRVGVVGQMLRKSSLDELPQLFNILRGDMSCVGPRPVVRDELERYGSLVGYYLRTRPGLTGLWQVTGRSSTEYAARVRLDAQYVTTWSLWADFVILCRTPAAVTRLSQVS